MRTAAIAALAALAFASMPGVHAEPGEIPDWVRTVASLWSQGLISDAEFTGAMSYIANLGIVEQPPIEHELAEFPYTIDTRYTTTDCEIVIHGVSGGMVQADITPEGAETCDIAVYEEAGSSLIGGIKATYADGTDHIVYAPWTQFDGDVTEWMIPPGEATGVIIAFHNTRDTHMDEFGTIFFDRDGVTSVCIEPPSLSKS